jgi:hypothetical protein
MSALAETLPVDCTAADLRADLATANAAAEPDTLSLTPGCSYTFGVSDIGDFWFGPEAMVVSSDVTIDGNGATIQRDPSAPPFRLFFVGADPASLDTLGYTTPGPGRLTLRNLTLSGGLAQGGSSATGGGGAGLGGAIFNQGSVTLDAVTLTGNSAVGGAGTGATGGQGGGGIGQNAPAGADGGGFGGTTAPAGAIGGVANGANGGGGGGFAGSDVGEDGTAAGPGVGGGPQSGLGGAGEGSAGANVRGGNGSGGGGQVIAPTAGSGGAFGEGGSQGGGGGVGGGGGLRGGGGFGGGGGSGGGDAGFGGGGGARGGGDAPGDGLGFGNDNPGQGGLTNGGGGSGLGGAIFNMQGTLSAVNSTFTGNAAVGGTSGDGTDGLGGGGAIFNLNGPVSLSFSTLAGNEAAGGGRAVYDLAYDRESERSASLLSSGAILFSSTFGATDLRAERPAMVAGAPNRATATATLSGRNIVRSSGGSGQIVGPITTADPQLGALAANGGPVQTMLPAASSPAIDAGSEGCPATDARGVARPQGAACDLGAAELVLRPPVTTNPPGAVPSPQPPPSKPPKATKAAPRPIGLVVSPKRDRKLPLQFNVSGRLRAPAGVKLAQACNGRMTVKLRRRAKTVAIKKPRLRLRAGRCVYSTKLGLRTRKRIGKRTKRLTVTARFPGNTVLKARSAKPVSVRVR